MYSEVLIIFECFADVIVCFAYLIIQFMECRIMRNHRNSQSDTPLYRSVSRNKSREDKAIRTPYRWHLRNHRPDDTEYCTNGTTSQEEGEEKQGLVPLKLLLGSHESQHPAPSPMWWVKYISLMCAVYISIYIYMYIICVSLCLYDCSSRWREPRIRPDYTVVAEDADDPKYESDKDQIIRWWCLYDTYFQ